MLTIAGKDGKPVEVKHEYRFQQGLRPEHAQALEGRQDLAGKLYAMRLWSVQAEDLDAAVEGLLKASAS